MNGLFGEHYRVSSFIEAKKNKKGKYMHSPIKPFVKRFRGEIIISTLSALFGLITSLIVQIYFSSGNLYLTGFYTFGVTIISLLVAMMFNQKRIFESKLEEVSEVLTDNFGHTSKDNQYYKRRTHYAEEKKLLATTLVKTVLPDVIKMICNKHPNLTKLNIIIDSGTTITPIFPELVIHGVKLPGGKSNLQFNIYTNCLSGVEEIHRMAVSTSYTLNERDFNLIGGQPLNKYRATTGKVAETFLESLWAESKDTDQVITLSILTANWFLAGPGLNHLSICARGPGHIEFKSNVSEHSNYRIFITPLGKLLRMSDVKDLNALLKNDDGEEYRSHPIADTKKDTTFVLTTHRDKDSLSPFRQITILLRSFQKNNAGKNYVLFETCPNYNPPGTTFNEAYFNKTPHKYIRDKFQEAYLFDPHMNR